MILTCPECSTRYMAKAGAIDTNGRSVRCVRCETVWFVEGGDPDTLKDSMALEDNKVVLVEVDPDPQPELPLEPSNSIPKTVRIGAHTRLRNKVDAEKLSKRMRVLRLIWAVPVITILGVVSVATLTRQAVVDKHPTAATLYKSVGLTVKTNGLDIQNLKTETLIVDGETFLRVIGDVKNTLSSSQVAPMIQMRLENRSGEPVADWFVDVGEIEAKGSKQIETDYPDPPLDGVELRYRFVED